MILYWLLSPAPLTAPGQEESCYLFQFFAYEKVICLMHFLARFLVELVDSLNISRRVYDLLSTV